MFSVRGKVEFQQKKRNCSHMQVLSLWQKQAERTIFDRFIVSYVYTYKHNCGKHTEFLQPHPKKDILTTPKSIRSIKY